jgi:chromosome segregation ATPase
MTIDELPDQLKEFCRAARAALDQQIAKAHKAADALNAEKSSAQNALSALQAECKSAQDQLKATTSEFDKVAASLGIGHDIAKLRAELKKVKVEIERATAAKATVEKQCNEADARLVTLTREAERQLAIRSESEAVMASLRAKILSVQLRH